MVEYDESGAYMVSDIMTNGISGARTIMMSGTAHVPSMEKPEEFNRAVLAFLGGVTVPNPRSCQALFHLSSRSDFCQSASVKLVKILVSIVTPPK